MKLVASLIVRNELGRYLETCVTHLLEFCDEIRIWDDGSDDETVQWLEQFNVGGQFTPDKPSPVWVTFGSPAFFQHEGQARNNLFHWTMIAEPTHILAIDADEFVTDGAAIRRVCEADDGNGAWTLQMEEVWAADARNLWIRQDGGWRAHPVPILYRVPAKRDGRWQIQNRALACGREPLAVRQLAGRAQPSGASVLHFGWANKAERQARYDRYAEADGGRFHTSSHLQSILFPDRKVRLTKRPWPPALEPYKAQLLERANREAVLPSLAQN